MLRINVSTAEAVITETELITSGRKGLRCAFTFNSAWDGLAKTVIVQGAATRDIALLATNEITVPAECVNKAQFPLKIGVYGAKPDGTIAIPTIWASFGKVLPGAKPSDIPPDELTPDVVAQVIEASGNALYLARNVQSMADSGAFDGEDGVSPTLSSTAITGGHQVAMTDKDGTTTFDVMDGEDGDPGVGVPSGGAAGDVLRKASSTDYDTEWHSPEIFWAVYDSTTADDIETARIDGKAIMCAYGGRTYIMNYRQNATKFYFTAADRNSFYILSVSGSTWSNVSTKTVGTYSKPSGGIPASDLVSGISVPTGGTTGQVLKKASGTDYDTEWANESGGGGGTDNTAHFAFEIDDTDNNAVTPGTGVTISAIATAASAGKACFADVNYVDSTSNTVLLLADYNSSVLTFTGGAYDNEKAVNLHGEVNNGADEWTATLEPDLTYKLNKNQGVAHAGEFCVVGSDGNITTVTMSVWQGGNYGS